MTKNEYDHVAPFDYTARDESYWDYLASMVERDPYSIKSIIMNFQTYARRRDIVRFIAHYELFKHIIDLPGSIIDLGVFRGASFFTWTKLMETFCPGDRHRLVYGFDHFKGLSDYAKQDDGSASTPFTCDGQELRDLVAFHNQDTMVPGIRRCVMIEGDVLETIPRFVLENPGVRIALLHLDMDLYRPTKFALEQLYHLVIKGGVICFDEYACTAWPGESQAVEEFFAELGMTPVLRKFSFSPFPGGYFIK